MISTLNICDIFELLERTILNIRIAAHFSEDNFIQIFSREILHIYRIKFFCEAWVVVVLFQKPSRIVPQILSYCVMNSFIFHSL